MKLRLLLSIIILSLTSISCTKSELNKPSTDANSLALTSLITIQGPINEDFELGSKTSYALGNINFNSGSWRLDDALVGTSSTDSKNGLKSIRIRNTGSITMNFSLSNGASTVTVKHALYGSDLS
ncbi:DNA/RNA non-specific endonuclease, partial [Pelobium sp.]|nr:DNA/RNA non-specific endonuclease [Pelobium sp.]